MSIKGAFNFMVSMQGREVTILRPGTELSATVKIAPSNYSRNLQAPSEIVITGREFVLPKSYLDNGKFPPPKRGDRMSDPEFGIMIISDINEMFDIGGSTIGYRIRTS